MTITYQQLLDRIAAEHQPIRLHKTSQLTQLYNDIVAATSFLPSTAKIKERIYAVSSNITSAPTCKRCPSPVSFLGPSTGYREYCSSKCRANDPQWQKQRAITCTDNHGAAFPAQAEAIKRRLKNTLKEKYGAGVTCTQQVTSVYEKTKATNMERYGTYHTNHRHMSTDVHTKLTDGEWLRDQHHGMMRTVNDISIELGVAFGCVQRYLDHHGIEYRKYPGADSFGQQQFTSFIEQCVPTARIVLNDSALIHPKHVDVLLPDLNLAFEYNGLYWHSEAVRADYKYHLNKTIACAEKGIKLIQVQENEWATKREIVESRIRSILGINRKIYARQCTVDVVPVKEANQFVEANHIQGRNNAAVVAVGLYHHQELVAVMTFCKSRYDKTYQYELLRMCNRLNVNVVGGASRMLHHFFVHTKCQSLVSYCDRRWSNGNMYQALGFELIAETSPNYWYFKSGSLEVHSRIKFQKHKLERSLSTYDPSLTEYENMALNGYNRIWDCGQLKFGMLRN